MSEINIKEWPKFSFSLPVYNASCYLEECLESIFSQDYPQDKIEVLLVDGGSTDNTLEIAKKFQVRIFDNPKRLADFGVKISARNATGDLLVIFAADNALVGKNWLSSVARLFLNDNNLCALWGRMISGASDYPVNKYYTLIQNDPLSFFANKNLEDYVKRAQVEKLEDKMAYTFQVDIKKPLIWGANGLVYRTEIVRDIILREDFIADNDVFQIMIESGNNKVAFIPRLNIYHHHVKNIKEWMSKWQRDFVSHFLKHQDTRNMRWVFDRNFKKKLTLWIFYSGIPVFSFLHSVYLMARDRSIYWLYHPVINFVQLIIYSYSMLSIPEGRNLIKKTIFQ